MRAFCRRAWSCLAVLAALLVGCGGGGGGGGSTVKQALEQVFSEPLHTAVSAGDMDGDGLVDVVGVSTTYSPERTVLSVYRQAAIGQFVPSRRITLGEDATRRSRAALALDLNQDGNRDVVVSHFGNLGSPGDSISVILQDPAAAGRLLSPVRYHVGTAPRGMASADLDGDGLTDLAVATRDGLKLLLQDGARLGRFLPAVKVGNLRATSVAAGDLNGDGLPDLACNESGAVQIYLQQRVVLGRFARDARLATLGQAGKLVMADLNRDGLVDIVAASTQPRDNSTVASIEVFMQDPAAASGFSPPRAYPIARATSFQFINAADLDADQRPDLIGAFFAAQDAGASVSVLLQDPSAAGALLPPVYYGRGLTPFGGALSDLDADAVPDLLVASGYDGIVALYQAPTGSTAYDAEVTVVDD